MVLVSGPYPDAANDRSGMIRRVASIDRMLDSFERVYLDFHRGPPGSHPPAAAEPIGPRVSRFRFNPLDPGDLAALAQQAERAACLLTHSVYWARDVLPLYRVRPTITDLHGAVPEENLMLGRGHAAAQGHERVEAFVLSHGAFGLCVSDAMAEHMRKKHRVSAELLTLPIEGGAIAEGVLDKPRALRVCYCGGVDVWQQVPLMARAVAAWPEQAFEAYSPFVDELSQHFRAAGAEVDVQSSTPAQLEAVYARCHFGFVLREPSVVNAVASPTKLQEYLAHGVVPIVHSRAIGDFEALGYRTVPLEQYLARALPDYAGWREMAEHNLGVARAVAAAVEKGRARLVAEVERAHRERRDGLSEGLLPHQNLAADFAGAVAQVREQAAAVAAREQAAATAAREQAVAEAARARAEAEAATRREHVGALDAVRGEHEALKHEARALRHGLRETQAALEAERRHSEWMRNTLSWKVTQPLRRGNQARRRAQARLEALRRPAPVSVAAPAAQGPAGELERLLASDGAPLVFTRPMLDWDWPMQQRPHHLARALGQAGFWSFFVTPNHRDRVSGFVRLGERCYLTDRFDLLLAAPRRRFMHVYSTDAGCELDGVRAARHAGAHVLYDVIDELHEDVAGQPISEAVRERHRVLLREATACTASAHRLLEAVRGSGRTGPFALVGNGVDLEHFGQGRPAAAPEALRPVLARGAKVVGYFGALAKWVDYGLLRALAVERPGLQVVLLGVDYDGSLAKSGLEQLPNVTRYGPVPWQELPSHAAFFDVTMVPFLKNDVTESTSPIKLFEALAMGKPVVTTDLRECRQSRTALVAKDAAEFIGHVDRALSAARDADFVARCRAEAAEHSWRAKAELVAQLLRSTWE